MAQRCQWCKGNGTADGITKCPVCDGSGQKFDPGREMTYEMGPFTLNAAAAANTTVPNYAVGAASTTAILNGVTCMVANWPFRWMFALAQRTFPFTVQIKDAGSGSGRSFMPQSLQIHSDNLFGTAQRPMPLPTPYVFRANQNITADFTDLYGATGFAGVTNGSASVTWVSGGVFNTSSLPYGSVPAWNGQTIVLNGVAYQISSASGSGVTSQTTLTLATTYQGTTNTSPGVAYSVSNSIRVAYKGVELSDTGQPGSGASQI